MKKELLEKIRAKGFRVTVFKEKILSIFEKAEGPLTVPELVKQLKRHKLVPHKSTLYRELESLVEATIIEEAKLHEGIQSYELRHENEDHHHHFICEKCSEVVDFENDALEETIVKAIRSLRRRGHVTKDHRLNFYGLCGSCQ